MLLLPANSDTSKEAQLNVTSEKPLLTPPLCRLIVPPLAVLGSYCTYPVVPQSLVYTSVTSAGLFPRVKAVSSLSHPLPLEPGTVPGVQEVNGLLSK